MCTEGHLLTAMRRTALYQIHYRHFQSIFGPQRFQRLSVSGSFVAKSEPLSHHNPRYLQGISHLWVSILKATDCREGARRVYVILWPLVSR